MRRSLEQQRKMFLDYLDFVKGLKTPSVLETFSGEKINVRPERTLQEIAAPNIFTRELELKLQKLSGLPREALAMEALRIKHYMDDVYKEIDTALSKVGYDTHKDALQHVSGLKEKLTEITRGNMEQITSAVEKELRDNKLGKQVSLMRESITKAKEELDKELGPEAIPTRRSFEQFQRNMVFTFAKPIVTGKHYRDWETLSWLGNTIVTGKQIGRAHV